MTRLAKPNYMFSAITCSMFLKILKNSVLLTRKIPLSTSFNTSKLITMTCGWKLNKLCKKCRISDLQSISPTLRHHLYSKALSGDDRSLGDISLCTHSHLQSQPNMPNMAYGTIVFPSHQKYPNISTWVEKGII